MLFRSIKTDITEDAELKDVGNNFLFYGNFYKIPFEKFNRSIRETIVDRENLYDSLSKDIYHQGIMLVKKFRKINLSYTVFIIGLILSILSFTLSFLVHMHLL